MYLMFPKGHQQVPDGNQGLRHGSPPGYSYLLRIRGHKPCEGLWASFLCILDRLSPLLSDRLYSPQSTSLDAMDPLSSDLVQ